MIMLAARRVVNACCVLLAAVACAGSPTEGRAEHAARSVATYELPVTLSMLGREVGAAAVDQGYFCVAFWGFDISAAEGTTPPAAPWLLAEHCEEHLASRLSARMKGKCRAIPPQQLRKALQEAGVAVGSSSVADRISAVGKALPDAEAVVSGRILRMADDSIDIECSLVDRISGETVGRWQGTGVLNFNEWALLGRSAALADYRETKDDVLYEDDLLDQLRALGREPHPLKSPELDFPIRIVVGGKERRGQFFHNQCVVRVAKGEKFAVLLKNPLAEVIHVKLLVNGRNTLPQKIDRDGLMTESPMSRVLLTEARSWILEPAVSGGNPRGEYAIQGFVMSRSRNGQIREFEVGKLVGDKHDAPSDQQCDLVTVAIYANHDTYEPRRSPFGTDDVETKKHEIGNLIGVFQIHIDSATHLDNKP